MELIYRDGRRGYDPFLDQPEDIQIAEVARHLALNPNDPSTWPRDIIRNLLGIRRYRGIEEFHHEINKMLGGS